MTKHHQAPASARGSVVIVAREKSGSLDRRAPFDQPSPQNADSGNVARGRSRLFGATRSGPDDWPARPRGALVVRRPTRGHENGPPGRSLQPPERPRSPLLDLFARCRNQSRHRWATSGSEGSSCPSRAVAQRRRQRPRKPATAPAEARAVPQQPDALPSPSLRGKVSRTRPSSAPPSARGSLRSGGPAATDSRPQRASTESPNESRKARAPSTVTRRARVLGFLRTQPTSRSPLVRPTPSGPAR